MTHKSASTKETLSVSGGQKSSSKSKRWLVIGVIVFLSIGALGAGLRYLEQSAEEEKRQQKNPLAAKNKSLLSAINPFSPSPTPSPTPLPLSKQYIYAGSRLLAVKDAGVDTPVPSDLTVWRPGNGIWYCLGGPGSQGFQVNWGNGALGDVPVPGDYDGDTKTDLAIWRPASGNVGAWWIYRSSNGTFYLENLGYENEKPVQADYDGDGKTDVAMFNPSDGTWRITYSSNSTTYTTTYGASGDLGIPADYTGDGKSDMAVWRNSTASFHAYDMTTGNVLSQSVGLSGDKPVTGDFDGDGRFDFATWRPSDNKWRIHQSGSGQLFTLEWGIQSTDIAVPSDYDADGKTDIAVWRSSGTYTGYWFILKSGDGQLRMEQWGSTGDIPVPSKYRR